MLEQGSISRVHMGTCIQIESGSIRSHVIQLQGDPDPGNPPREVDCPSSDQVDRARLKMGAYLSA